MEVNRSRRRSSQKLYNDEIDSKWLTWCRLCAKRELSNQESISIFLKNESRNLGSELATSIGKYFWVNIKAEDEISQCLCLECKQLIEQLVSFTERVNKVQTLYCLLQNIRPTSVEQADKLRSQCGLSDEGWQHIIKSETRKVKEIPQVILVDKEIQTGETLLSSKETEADRGSHEIFDIIQKSDDSQTKIDDAHVYAYVMNDDNEMEFVENDEYIEPLNSLDNQLVKHATAETTENEDVQDSDLFKELKYKTDDNDEEDEQKDTKNFEIISEVEEVEVDYQESSQSMQQDDDDDGDDDDDLEHSIEMLEEEVDDEDYVTISDNQINDAKVEAIGLLKGKRGRPFGSKNVQSDDSPYRFECIECKRRYKNPNIFRKHMLSIHNVAVDDLPDFKSMSNTCTVCSKKFLTRSSLKLHMRHHLPDEEKYNVPCPYCDRKFSQVGAMRQHVNGIHHQMKPFICDQCGRACKTMAALNEHQLVHTNECPFECEVCHKRFKNKPRLKSHMDTHNISVYKCEDCGLELNTKRTLLQHRLVHSDVKRFKCEFCDAAFKRSKALKNHLILHSGLRPYICNFCNKSFSNGSNCRAHKKRAHPKALAEEEATGKEPERMSIPKLEELKSAKGVLLQPRKIKRRTRDLPHHLRKLLQSSEKSKQDNCNEYEDSTEIDEPYSEFQYEIAKSEVDEIDSLVDNPSEECEETVIYEIIDEI